MIKEQAEIIRSLEPMFERANREGLWFYCSYQQMWFTPYELQNEQNNGRLIWGPSSWQLRSPYEKLAQLEKALGDAQRALDECRRKIGRV